MTEGYQNEIDFINEINNKKVKELNPLLYDLVKTLYPTIKDNEVITAKKYGRYAKTDIVITIRNKNKGLSIKMGYKNSVHVEHLNTFKRYLERKGITKNTIDKLYRYIYSDGTNNNTGEVRLSNAEYIEKYEEDIKELNIIFNLLKSKLIDRFLIETDINYRVKVDAIIHGTPNDFIWVTSDDVKNYLENEDIISTSLHTGKLYIQSWNKNIVRNTKYEHCRDYIQVKWFSMYDDLINIMSRRSNK